MWFSKQKDTQMSYVAAAAIPFTTNVQKGWNLEMNPLHDAVADSFENHRFSTTEEVGGRGVESLSNISESQAPPNHNFENDSSPSTRRPLQLCDVLQEIQDRKATTAASTGLIQKNNIRRRSHPKRVRLSIPLDHESQGILRRRRSAVVGLSPNSSLSIGAVM